jgi:hypothetical protein
LSSGDTDNVNGPVIPPRPAAACGKRRDKKARSIDSKNCTPSGVIVTRYQVSKSETNTNAVPTTTSPSLMFLFRPPPLEAILGRNVDDEELQAAAGAASRDIDSVGDAEN